MADKYKISQEDLIKLMLDFQNKAIQRATEKEKPLSIEEYAKKAVSSLLKKLNIEPFDEK